MKKIFINICEEKLGINTPKTYLKSYQDLYNSHNIYTYIYYIGEQENSQKYDFIKSFSCKNEHDLKKKILNTYSQNQVLFINTFTEGLISITNQIKKENGEEITIKHESFRDKSLQRKFLQDHNPELGIKYINSSPQRVNADEIEKYLGYPYIVKPSSGIQSAGVAIIHSKEELNSYIHEYDSFLAKFKARGFKNDSLVFEEFIDGVMYSIDYFVNQEGKIISSEPVHVGLGEDIEINDFMNYVRSFRTKTIGNLDASSLNNLIQGTVSALGIKNTFIHHEFKLTSKGKLKTIEVNGRIGGYRLEMIQEAFNFNWLSVIHGDIPSKEIKNNFSSFLIYPEKKGILAGFNQELFSKVEKLGSTYFINRLESFIGKEIGLTSQGFTKVAIIKIKNYDIEQFEGDYKFIEENFKNLLMLK